MISQEEQQQQAQQQSDSYDRHVPRGQKEKEKKKNLFSQFIQVS